MKQLAQGHTLKMTTSRSYPRQQEPQSPGFERPNLIVSPFLCFGIANAPSLSASLMVGWGCGGENGHAGKLPGGESQVLPIRGYSKLKLKTLRKFSSSFWFVSSRWNFFSHLVQTDGKRHWWFPPTHLKTQDEKNCGSRDTGKWLIFGSVEVNRQATNFQLLFKFSPKGFSNLRNSHCFISGSE